MQMNKAELEAAGKLINAAHQILLISHKRPDGDAIGSLLGFGLALKSIGKDIQMVSVDGVPGKFKQLEGSELIHKQVVSEFDLVCILDCSDLDRIGNVLNRDLTPDINIDHHSTNLNFAHINLVDTSAVSTTQILVRVLKSSGIPLTKSSADAMLTGLITDTIGFQTANMTPEALRLAADLTEYGCNLHDIYRRVLGVRSYEATRMWGAGLSRLTRDGGLVWTVITQNDRKESGYPGKDDAELVNILVAIEDAKVALIFLEQPDSRVKVSWRSNPEIDVSEVAVHFGGGGHANAAGADISGSLDFVQNSVLDATRPLLQPSRNMVEIGKGN